MSSDLLGGRPPSGSCPDLDTLADLHADVLDDHTAAEVRRHTATCAQCQEVLAALDATVATLASLPPVQLPAHVAARLDRALAEESGRITPLPAAAPQAPTSARPATGSVPAPPSGSNVVDFGAARERKRGGPGRWLLAAAAAAAVITGVVVVSNQDSGTTGPNQNAAAEQTTDGEDATQAGPADSLPGRTLQGSTPSQVLENSPIVDDAANEQMAGEMAEATARNKCLNAIPDRPVAAPEAVQMGMYDGQEAYGFVFAVKDSPTDIVMWVVSAADCSDVMAKVEGTR